MRSARVPGCALLVLLAACARPVAVPPAAPPVLRVATSGDYPPFSDRDAAGARGGLDVVLATRLAADLDRQLVFVPLAWPDLERALVDGAFDVALSGVTMRADRALLGRYTRPYAVTGAVVVVPAVAAARWASLAAVDRPGVRVGVNAGGHLERTARGALRHATIVPIAGNRIAAALAAGEVEAIVTDTAELAAWPGERPVALPPFTHDHKAGLLPAGDAALAAAIDAWLAAREADGWLDAQRVQALGPEAAMDPATAGREAVAAFIRLRLALMPDVAAAKHAAGLPIEDRAQEQRVLERVRARVPNDAERAVRVYAELIELAKAVQRRMPERPPSLSLDTLRAALGRIDDGLSGALATAPPGDVAAWRTTLTATLAPAIDAAAIARLAETLAAAPPAR